MSDATILYTRQALLLAGIVLYGSLASAQETQVQELQKAQVSRCERIIAYDDYAYERAGLSDRNDYGNSSTQDEVNIQAMIEACRQAISQYPNELFYHYQLAQAHYNHLDYIHAYDIYRQAAKRGYAPAQHSLGKLYRMGRGVAQSDTQAVIWFSKAAKQGNILAQSDLGGMYYQGRGTAQSDDQALKWTLLAAEQGDSYAQYNIGLMYEMGCGVTQSYKTAAEWY